MQPNILTHLTYLSTDLAEVGFLTRMNSRMHSQGRSLNECLPTVWVIASMWFIATMYSLCILSQLEHSSRPDCCLPWRARSLRLANFFGHVLQMKFFTAGSALTLGPPASASNGLCLPVEFVVEDGIKRGCSGWFEWEKSMADERPIP